MKRMGRFTGASKVDAHCIPVHFVIGGRRTSAEQTTSMFAGARGFRLSFRGPTSANTYQAPGVKRANESYDVVFRRLVGFREGSVVGL